MRPRVSSRAKRSVALPTTISNHHLLHYIRKSIWVLLFLPSFLPSSNYSLLHLSLNFSSSSSRRRGRKKKKVPPWTQQHHSSSPVESTQFATVHYHRAFPFPKPPSQLASALVRFLLLRLSRNQRILLQTNPSMDQPGLPRLLNLSTEFPL